MPMSKYQVATMNGTEVTLFSLIEVKFQEDQINAIQMQKFILAKTQVTSIFSVFGSMKTINYVFLSKHD